jgi:hypothetical protein
MGAVGFYFLYHQRLWEVLWPGASWYWDGFWSIVAGLLIGGNAGEGVARRSTRFRGSDGPSILGVICGVGIMAAVWLYLPVASASVVGAVSRVAFGAYVGSFFAELITSDPYGSHTEDNSSTQRMS